MSLDDVPIGGKGVYDIEEDFLLDEEPEEDSGPLAVRLESKVWRTRAQAYSDLADLVASGSPTEGVIWEDKLTKWLGDVHPGAQESAMALIMRLLIHQPQLFQGPRAIDIAKTAIEKAITSSKSSIKSAATDLIVNLFQGLDEDWEGFALEIATLMEQKNPKVQSATVYALTQLLTNFGPAGLPIKQWLSLVERATSSPNLTVRSDSLRFLKEVYRWLHESLFPFLPRVKKELIEEIKQTDLGSVPVTPIKVTKQVHTRNLLDAFEMSDAKDIFVRFNEAWCEQVVGMEKWTDRKEALETLNTEADVPRLADKPADALVALSKRLLNDSNVQVVTLVIRLLGLLAKGQKNAFEQPAKHFLPLLVLKFRDKKPQIVSETHQTLLRLLKSIKLSYILEKMPKFLEDKTPSVRVNLFLYMEAWISSEPDQTLPVCGSIVDMVKRYVGDNVAEVRDAATNLIGEYVSKTDASVVLGVIKDLPAGKVKRIQEIAGERGRKETGGSTHERKPGRATTLPHPRGSERPPIPRIPIAEEVKMPVEVSPARKPVRTNTQIPRSRTRLDLNTSQEAGHTGSMSPMPKKRKSTELNLKLSVEELREDFGEKLKEQCKGLFAQEVLVNMFHKDFRKVVEAAGMVTEVIRREELDKAEVVGRWIYMRLFDTNTQVVKAVLEVASALLAAYAAANAQLQDNVATILIPILCERLGHNNTAIRTQVRQVIEQSYPVQVPSRYMTFLSQGLASKNTRTRTECLETLTSAIRDLSAPPPPIKDLKTAAKLAGHSDTSLRNAAVGLFTELNARFPEIMTQVMVDIPDRKARELLEQKVGARPRSQSKPRTPEPPRSVSPMKSDSPFKPLPTDRVLEVQHHQETPTPRFEAAAQMSRIPEPEFHFPTNETLLYEDTGKLEFDQEPSSLDRNIQVLRTGDMSSRVDALVAVNDILMNSLEKHRAEVQHKASHLLDAMCVVLTNTFDRPAQDIPLRFAKYYLNVLQKVCSTSTVMREASENTVLTLVTHVLSKLLMEDLGKTGERGEGEQLLKLLNATMVKILEYSQPTVIVSVLFRLLTVWRTDSQRTKHIALTIKCLLKLEKVLNVLARTMDLRAVLLKAHDFVLTIGSESEDSATVKAVKGIVMSLAKAVGPTIWEAYEGVKRHPQQDVRIVQWIQTAQDGFESMTESVTRSDPLSDIFVKLKAAETYDDGLRDLLAYRNTHPVADLSPHLKICSHALFDRITDDLRCAAIQESDQEPSFKISDFQSRLSSMKKRYGLASNNTSEHLTTTLTELKNKVNLLLSTARPESTALATDARVRLEALRK